MKLTHSRALKNPPRWSYASSATAPSRGARSRRRTRRGWFRSEDLPRLPARPGERLRQASGRNAFVPWSAFRGLLRPRRPNGGDWTPRHCQRYRQLRRSRWPRGVFVDRTDPAAIAEALGSFQSDSGRVQGLGNWDRRYIRERVLLEDTDEGYWDIYEWLL